MQNIIIMIPARLGSTRLQNKPLAKINGREMILKVCDRAKESGIDNIVVACSEIEVKNLVESQNYRAIMTDPNLPSGTDRINAALSEIPNQENLEYVVNLQGDLPDINPEIITRVLAVFEADPETDIATAVVKITDKKLESDPNVVNAVVNFESGDNCAEAHYFSRATVPYNANVYYEHIGIYVYRKEALQKFVRLDPSEFEKCEKLEQLRAIENGMKISACLIPNDMKPISIDTKEDLELISLAGE